MANPKRGRKKFWSFNAGERGRGNWVRAFEHSRDRSLYLEYDAPVTTTDPETGEDTTVARRRRAKLKAEDQTRERARAKAMALSERLSTLGTPTTEPPVTVKMLLADYLKEVTPRKGPGKRGHDGRAARLWSAFLDAQTEVGRRLDRHPSTLDRRDWDGFIAARHAGAIAGFEREVKGRQVQYDLKFMVAVLNWGTGSIPAGGSKPYLPTGSPWAAAIRRAQKWEMPRERNPRRPSMPDDVREGLIAHAPSWQLGAALRLELETRRRNSSIRRLRWSDVDLEAETVRWRGEFDKARRELVTPLTPAAAALLRRLPSRGIGAAPVFPAAGNAAEPTSRDTFQTWLARAKARWLKATPEDERAALRSRLSRVGFHAEKRSGVRAREFRELSPIMQELIAGTSYEVLRTVYDEVTVEEVREAMKKARLNA